MICMPQPFRRSGHTWLLYLSYAIFGYVLNGLGAVTPFLRAELNLSYTVASLLFSAFAAGMIAAGVGGHRLVAHFGRKGLVWFGVFAMCTSELVLMAGRSAWLAIGASFLMGASGSLLASVVPPGLSDEHGESRSLALSELSLIAATSSAAALLLIGWFSYTVLGWRTGLALPFAACPAPVVRSGAQRGNDRKPFSLERPASAGAQRRPATALLDLLGDDHLRSGIRVFHGGVVRRLFSKDRWPTHG